MHQPEALLSPIARSIVRCAILVALASAVPAAPLVLVQGPPGEAASEPPIRVGLRARNGGADRLTSMRYIGGFETKTLLIETLVRRGSDGRVEGGIVSRWTVENGGRTFRMQIADGARFHDGTRVTAEIVCAHFRRWIGHVEHDWLRANRHIEGVEAVGEREFLVHLDQPYALLEDLLAINPCALVAPGSNDWEGEFVRPVGTGPFRFVGAFDDGARWRLAPADGSGPLLDVTFYPRGRDTRPLDDLLRGAIDVFVGGWEEDLPSDRLTEFEQDPRFEVVTAEGSSVVYLSFRMSEGPTSELAVRRRIADALDRGELIRIVEGGRAEPCRTWAAPSVLFWPEGPAAARQRRRAADATPAPAAVAEPGGALPKLVISGGRGGRAARVAIEVTHQLGRAGFDAEYLAPPARLPEAARAVVDANGAVRPLTTESGEVRAAAGRAARERSATADVVVEVTHGMPYCPHQSLVARFGARRSGERPRRGGTPELEQLVERAAATPLEDDRLPLYSQIQTLMDEQVLIVPLYSPWRVAVHATGFEGVRLDPDVYHVDLRGLRRVAPR